MKKNIIHISIVLILVFALQSYMHSQEKLTIAVVPKGNIAIYWKSIHAGVKLGATALGDVEVFWRAPLEDNTVTTNLYC